MSNERITQRLRWVEEQLDLVELKINDTRFLVGHGWETAAAPLFDRRKHLETLQMKLLEALEAQESVG